MTKHSDAPAASTTRILQVLVASFTSTTTANNNIALRLFKRDNTSCISIIGFCALKPLSEVRFAREHHGGQFYMGGGIPP
jgi:hypothetical protein